MGFCETGLAATAEWLATTAAGRPYRVLLLCDGWLVGEWHAGIDPEARFPLRSASKSAYSLLLGIAVRDGLVASLETPVIDVYPEMMAVGEHEGPKPGRYAHPANRGITFRQLAGNTSGYLKPEEPPGKVFHYQTFGMNVLSNAIATAYGLYDSSDQLRLPGAAQLVAEKIREPIGGCWEHAYFDFDYSDRPAAKRGIFGHGLHLVANADDAARLGLLWLNQGEWKGRSVVPWDYLAMASRTNAEILTHGHARDCKYGLGFWVNDHGELWPELPRDIFGAWGANAIYVWVSPARRLVMVLCPAPWDNVDDEAERRLLETAFLRHVLAAAT
ncbi:MAG: beta-lactamase family protein [Rhodospirillales bacterium]|nr:beta-lactamase family protein [Rhodospirillales bacterium]